MIFFSLKVINGTAVNLEFLDGSIPNSSHEDLKLHRSAQLQPFCKAVAMSHRRLLMPLALQKASQSSDSGLELPVAENTRQH